MEMLVTKHEEIRVLLESSNRNGLLNHVARDSHLSGLLLAFCQARTQADRVT